MASDAAPTNCKTRFELAGRNSLAVAADPVTGIHKTRNFGAPEFDKRNIRSPLTVKSVTPSLRFATLRHVALPDSASALGAKYISTSFLTPSDTMSAAVPEPGVSKSAGDSSGLISGPDG